MTEAEWRASTDPAGMIDWLERLRHTESLWDFAVECCRRVAHEIPAGPARRVAEHVDQVGIRGVDDLLGETAKALDKLERRLLRVEDATEQARLNRRLGFGRMVFAFECQDGASAARAISGDLLAWATEPEAERGAQAALLRELVPIPSPHAEPDAAPDGGGN